MTYEKAKEYADIINKREGYRARIIPFSRLLADKPNTEYDVEITIVPPANKQN